MAAALLHSASLARPNVASHVAAQPSTSALALVPARRKQGTAQRTSVRSQSAFETVSMVSQVATTAAVCIGAYMLLQQSSGPLPEQVRTACWHANGDAQQTALAARMFIVSGQGSCGALRCALVLCQVLVRCLRAL